MIIAAAMFMLTATVLFPQGRGRNRRQGVDMMKHSRFGIRMAEKNLFPAKMVLKFKDKLALTEKQVNALESMQQSVQEATIRAKAETKIQELKLQSYLKQNKINRKKMEKMIRSIAAMKTNMKIDHMNYLLDVKAVLTAEQVKKIEEFKKRRRRGMRSRKSKQGQQRKFRKRSPRGQGVQDPVKQDPQAMAYNI